MSATSPKKQCVALSVSALDQLDYSRLAGHAMSRPGAVVGCGTLSQSRVYQLANLAVSERRPVYLCHTPEAGSGCEFQLPEQPCPLEQARAQLHARGYYCHSMRISPPGNVPEEIAFLHLSGTDSKRIEAALVELYPRVSRGGVVVVEGVRLSDHRLWSFDAHASDRGVTPDLQQTRHGYTWWIKDVQQLAAETPQEVSRPSAAYQGHEQPFVVLSYPNHPRGKFQRMCELAGYLISTDPTQAFDFAIKWFGETFTPRDQVLTELAAATRVLNINCEDISKTRVEEVHQAVFGYGMAVDPRVYEGLVVQKANLNAECRESVVNCPMEEPSYGFVYQRLIMTPREPDEFEEYRVPITGNEIPCVVIKRRPLESRFDRCAGYAVLAETPDVFTLLETDRILEMCRRMGLEFGDVDVLREASTGQIYVIDLNPTPGGPGGGYTEDQRTHLIAKQLRAFQATFATR